jgi:hypothetical protein
MLIEALHPEFADALHGEDDVIVNGETVNPRLHVAMHQVVANQVLGRRPARDMADGAASRRARL